MESIKENTNVNTNKKSVGRILIGADDEGYGGLSFPVYKKPTEEQIRMIGEL